jgi:hypothetical protein
VIGLLCAAALAADPSLGVQRVDVLSEDPGLWLNDEAVRLGDATSTSAIRFVEQIKLVWLLPLDGLTIGTSLASQSLTFEQPVLVVAPEAAAGLAISGGVQAKALLPRGLHAGIAWRHGPVRVGLSVNALSSASWARPDWSVWRMLPGVGVGIGRRWAPQQAPWME